MTGAGAVIIGCEGITSLITTGGVYEGVLTTALGPPCTTYVTGGGVYEGVLITAPWLAAYVTGGGVYEAVLITAPWLAAYVTGGGVYEAVLITAPELGAMYGTAPGTVDIDVTICCGCVNAST